MNQVYECLYQKVYPQILKEVKNIPDTEDLFQTLCISLWTMGQKKSLDYKGEASFFKLCKVIWQRKWWEIQKRNQKHPEPDERDFPVEVPEDPEKKNAFDLCWKSLTVDCRRLIFLRMHGYSFEEILDIYKEEEPAIKAGALRVRYHRCYSKLSDCTRKTYFS